MSAHTPGPWRLSVGGAGECLVVGDASTESGLAEDDVAEVYGGNDADPVTQAANARLIAAAPDLLDLLEYALNQHDRHALDSERRQCPVCTRLSAVLAEVKP